MNVSLAAQLESPLLNSLASSIVSKPFNYSLKENYPMLSKSNISVSPVVLPSGAVYSKKLTFKLPKYGLVTGIAIKVTTTNSATKTATLTRTSRLGSRFFKNISLRSHNRVVQDNHSEYIDQRISNSPAEKENAYTNMCTPPEGIDIFGSVPNSTFYTPTFMFFGERSEAALDLAFCEPLELVCEVNTSVGMWGSDELLFSMNFSEVEAIVYYTNLENQTQAALTASQFPLSSNLTMLTNDSYIEVPVEEPYTSGATLSITLNAKTNHVCTATHFVAIDQKTNALLPIDSVTLVSSGQTLVDSTRRSQIYENAQYDKFVNNVPGSSAGINQYSIFYGYDADKTYISGAQAFDSLNAPTFKCIVDTSSLGGATTVVLQAVHDYAMYITVNSADGSVQRSLAN